MDTPMRAMIVEQKDHFIQTDPYLGINEDNVEQAIKILNK